MGHVSQTVLTQLLGVIDLPTSDVRYRHLSSGRKIKALLPLKAKRVFGKLWQLPCPRQRSLINDVGDINLLITMCLGVRIQHELGQCTVQSGEVTSEH